MELATNSGIGNTNAASAQDLQEAQDLLAQIRSPGASGRDKVLASFSQWLKEQKGLDAEQQELCVQSLLGCSSETTTASSVKAKPHEEATVDCQTIAESLADLRAQAASIAELQGQLGKAHEGVALMTATLKDQEEAHRSDIKDLQHKLSQEDADMKALTATQGDDLQKLHAELEDLHTQLQNSVEDLSASQGGVEAMRENVECRLHETKEVLQRVVNAELSHQKCEGSAHAQLAQDVGILHQGLLMLTQAFAARDDSLSDSGVKDEQHNCSVDSTAETQAS